MPPNRTPNNHIILRAPTPQTLPSLKRLNALLLPINYPESFYNEIITSPTTTRLTRLAFWLHTPPRPTTIKVNGDTNGEQVEDGDDDEGEGKGGGVQKTREIEQDQGICVGGVRCRLEPPPTTAEDLPPPSDDALSPSPPPPPRGGSIYIMTLCTLSPYRHLGVGTQLITDILSAAVELGCSEIYAHVWEANTEALDWYRGRGFDVDGGEVVQGYYRKLRPAGARVVRRKIGVGDALAIAEAGVGG